MASGFDFAFAVRAAMRREALTNEQYLALLLKMPFVRQKMITPIQVGNKIYSQTIKYADTGIDFFTWGVEGGTARNRLSSGHRYVEIYKTVCRIFVTDDELELMRLQNISLPRHVAANMGYFARKTRVHQLVDSWDNVITENEASSYPSMVVSDDSTPISYDITYSALQKFDGYPPSDLAAWVFHSDLRPYLQGLADTIPEPGTKAWVSKNGNQLYIHGIPVYFQPWEDQDVLKDNVSYSMAGLRYVKSEGPPIVYGYRAYLVTRGLTTQHVGWAPRGKVLDVAPVAPGMPGYPSEGAPSGVEWYEALLLANEVQLPKAGYDRLGLVQLLHAAA